MPSLFFTFNLVNRKKPVKPVKMYSFRKIPWQQARQSCSFPTVLILGKHRKSHVKSLSENEGMGCLRPCCQLVSVNVPQASIEYKCNGTIESKTKPVSTLGLVMVLSCNAGSCSICRGWVNEGSKAAQSL